MSLFTGLVVNYYLKLCVLSVIIKCACYSFSGLFSLFLLVQVYYAMSFVAWSRGLHVCVYELFTKSETQRMSHKLSCWSLQLICIRTARYLNKLDANCSTAPHREINIESKQQT